MDGNPQRADIDDTDAFPKWTATGGLGFRVRNLSKRHKKLLSVLETDMENEMAGSVSVGHREAVAALLEYYHENPSLVGDVTGGNFR